MIIDLLKSMEKGHLWSGRVKVLWLTMYLSLLIIFYTNIFSLTADCEPWKFLGENGNVCQKCPIGAKPRWCSEFIMNFSTIVYLIIVFFSYTKTSSTPGQGTL